MSWWLSFKNIYGLIMGTSTDWMKRSDRPHWPTAWHQLHDNLYVFLGGTGNCGAIKNGEEFLLINCNSGHSTKKLKEALGGSTARQLIGTSCFPDYIGGFTQFDFEKVYLPPGSELSGETITTVADAAESQWGSEKVIIENVKGAFSSSDLVVYLPNSKVLFLGGLFFNQIHPIIDKKRGLNPKLWRQELMVLLEKYPAETIVPHEGDLCGPIEVQLFMSYLDSLSDPMVEFSYCRQHFDWNEIPGYTSLEENFDSFRNAR